MNLRPFLPRPSRHGAGLGSPPRRLIRHVRFGVSALRGPIHARIHPYATASLLVLHSAALASYADKGHSEPAMSPTFSGPASKADSYRPPVLSRLMSATGGTRRMKAYDFKVLLEPDETGGYVATCPSLPGCHSQGDTVDGALDNIREAIELCLEDMQAPRGGHPGSLPSPGRKRRRHPMTSGLPVVSGRVRPSASSSSSAIESCGSAAAISGFGMRLIPPESR